MKQTEYNEQLKNLRGYVLQKYPEAQILFEGCRINNDEGIDRNKAVIIAKLRLFLGRNRLLVMFYMDYGEREVLVKGLAREGNQ